MRGLGCGGSDKESAVANKRTSLLQGVPLNGVAVGGAASLSFDPAYKDVIRSTPDNAQGIAEVTRSGLRVPFTFDCSDVTKVNQLLTASGATTFHAKQAGTVNWTKYTISNAALVATGMRLALSKNADPKLTLSGLVNFNNSTDGLSNIITPDDSIATAPTRTSPLRLYRPQSASFDPTGAPPAISPIHVQNINLSLDAEVAEDYGDGDIAVTSVDIKTWNTLRLTMTFRDATKVTGPMTIAAQLADAAVGILAATLLDLSGGRANQVLTVNNLLWTGETHKERGDFSEFTLNGECGWIAAAATYKIDTGTKLFSFA